LGAGLLALALTGAPGCRTSSSPTETTEPRAPVGERESLDVEQLRALIASQGDGGAALFVSWPGNPSSVDLRLLPVDESTLGLSSRLLELMHEPTPELEANGWALDRPAILSLFEFPMGDAGIGLVSEVDWAFGRPTGHDRLPGLVMRARLPARNVKALMASLSEELAGSHATFDALVQGRSGARAWTVEPGGWLALLPGPDHVQLVAQLGGRGPLDLASARACLDVTPALLPDGPALHNLDGAPYGGLLRMERFPAVDAWIGARVGLELLDQASPEFRDRSRLIAVELALGGELDAVDELPETGLLSIRAWKPEPAVTRARIVVNLTRRGHEGLLAVERAARPGLRPKAEHPALYLGLGLSTAGSTGGSEVLPSPAPTSLAELRAMLEEMTAISSVYISLRHPVGLLSQVQELLLRELGMAPDVAIHGAQLVVLEEQPFRSAIAIVVSPTFDLERLRLGAPRGVEVHETRRGEDRVVLVGMQVDPREVFDAASEAPLELMEATTSLSPLLRQLGIQGASGDRSRFWARHIDSALVMEEVTWHREDRSPPPPDWPSFAGLAPSPDVRPSAVRGCLVRAARALHAGLVRNSQNKAHRHAVLEEEHPAMLEALRCAAEDATTARRAQRLRRLGELALTAPLRTEHDDEALLGRLRVVCDETKDQAICDEVQALAARPRPTLPEVDAACEIERFAPPAFVRLTASAIAFDDRVFESEREAVRAAIATTNRSESPPIGIIASPDVSMKRLLSVLDAMRAEGQLYAMLATRSADTRAQWDFVYFGSLPKWARGMGKAFELRRKAFRSWGDAAPKLAAACGRTVLP
jgi:hypothetical protein